MTSNYIDQLASLLRRILFLPFRLIFEFIVFPMTSSYIDYEQLHADASLLLIRILFLPLRLIFCTIFRAIFRTPAYHKRVQLGTDWFPIYYEITFSKG